MRYQRSLTTLLLFILVSSCTPTEKAPNLQPISTGTSIITLTVPPTATLTSTSTPTPTLVPMSDFMSGMTFSTGPGFYYGFDNPIGENQLANVVKPMGVTWVGLMFQCSMSTIDSPIVTCNTSAGTPSDRSIKHIIMYAKNLGLRVMLKPFIHITNGYAFQIRMKNEADWQTFFSSYTEGMVHLAEISAETGVDYFSVGTEMNNTQYRDADWRKVIQAIRSVYPGPLTYGANPGGAETSISWWDALDAIGVDVYYPLTNLNNPTVDQLKAGWKTHASVLEALSKKWDRPIIFTEAGYASVDGINTKLSGDILVRPIDLQEQADCYQALIETFRDKPWWKGVFWFEQNVLPSEGGPASQLFEVNGKPAENVLRAFNGQPPFPTPTPIPNYDSENNQYLEIYSDQLGYIWELPAIFTNADIASTDQVFNGRYSLKVHLNPWGSIAFWADPVLDLSGYDFLEFYIYVDKIKTYYPNINVAFFDADNVMILAMPDIMRPGYVEDGELTIHQWHRIRIPLVELGAVNQKIRSLMFTNQAQFGIVDFYLDNISLVKYNQMDGTPQPISTPIIYPDASLPTTEVIYDDKLNPNWNNYPPQGDPANILLDQSDIAMAGNAIKVKLLNFSPLDLRNDMVDWKKSQWLEFDLQVESINLPDRYGLNVILRDATYKSSPVKIDLMRSQFIDGGKIKPGSWQHVQIPLDLFGTSLGNYVMISIERPGHGSDTPLIIYVDNVILRGKTTESLSDGQPQPQSTKIATNGYSDDKVKIIYDNFDDPKYDGSLNNLLWTREDQSSSTAKVIQQDGILMISDMENTIDQGALLTLSKWQNPTFGFLEARIKVHYDSGSNGNLALVGVSPSIKGGWTEMSLTPDDGGATMRVLGFAEARVENDTWYIFRIEYDDKNNVLSFFLDGKLVTSYEAPNKIESLIPQINLWHPEGGSGVGYIDYVAIGD